MVALCWLLHELAWLRASLVLGLLLPSIDALEKLWQWIPVSHFWYISLHADQGHTLASLSCYVPFCTKALTLGWHLTFFSGTLELAQSLSRSLHCFQLALLSATRSIWLVICHACVDFDWWLIIILCPKIHKQCERTNYESVWKSFLMVCIMTCTCNPLKFTCLKCVLDSVQ